MFKYFIHSDLVIKRDHSMLQAEEGLRSSQMSAASVDLGDRVNEAQEGVTAVTEEAGASLEVRWNLIWIMQCFFFIH